MTAAQMSARAGMSQRRRRSSLLSWRLLRLELRRNVMLWIAPLPAALFYLTAYRSAVALPPLWSERLGIAQPDALLAFAPFVAGAAAWMGSREGRTGMTDLVAVSARPRFTGQLATWAATTSWAVTVYLACMGVLYGVTAHQATWGAPTWWPLAVGTAAIGALCALGFVAGAFFPSPFTTPLAAITALLVFEVPFRVQIKAGRTTSMILPTTNLHLPPLSAGIFYPVAPDLYIVQTIFLVGLVAGALGVLGLRASAGTIWSRCGVAVLAGAGIVAVTVAVGLVGDARIRPSGAQIPSIRNVTYDKPIAYTPVCSHAAVPVCLHPALKSYLPDMTAALAPLLDQVAGLPGAPVRVEQIADWQLAPLAPASRIVLGPNEVVGDSTLGGKPPVLRFFLGALPGIYGLSTAAFTEQLRLAFAQAVTAGDTGGVVTPAQRAVAAALMRAAGVHVAAGAPVGGVPGGGPPPNGPGAPVQTGLPAPVHVAAVQFANLPASTRHAWLATHLAALRAGRVTLAQLP
jgi:hypothetical protein